MQSFASVGCSCPFLSLSKNLHQPPAILGREVTNKKNWPVGRIRIVTKWITFLRRKPALLSGELNYIVPFMCAVLAAKLVGDMMTPSIYDAHAKLNGFLAWTGELGPFTFCPELMRNTLSELGSPCGGSAAPLNPPR